MSYRDNHAALSARKAALDAEVARATRERDEVARLIDAHVKSPALAADYARDHEQRKLKVIAAGILVVLFGGAATASGLREAENQRAIQAENVASARVQNLVQDREREVCANLEVKRYLLRCDHYAPPIHAAAHGALFDDRVARCEETEAAVLQALADRRCPGHVVP